MDISDDNQKQVTSDDQELAKALAGVGQGTDIGFEETAPAPMAEPISPLVQPITPAAPDPVAPVATTISVAGAGLDGVKQEAIAELRPLIDKLDVDPEEKFNTYLLLIRSTDDRSLIAPAHEAAKNIADETKKAQALLDIIKEIDFLSNPQ